MHTLQTSVHMGYTGLTLTFWAKPLLLVYSAKPLEMFALLLERNSPWAMGLANFAQRRGEGLDNGIFTSSMLARRDMGQKDETEDRLAYVLLPISVNRQREHVAQRQSYRWSKKCLQTH